MSHAFDALLTERPDHPGALHFRGARMVFLDVEDSFWELRERMDALVGTSLADAVLQQAGARGGEAYARLLLPESPMQPAEAVPDCMAALQSAGFGSLEVLELEWPVGRVLVRARDTFEAWATIRHVRAGEGPRCAYTSGILVGLVNAMGARRDVVCRECACQAQGADACVFELLPGGAPSDHETIGIDPNPLLTRHTNLLEVLFERVPLGLAIYNPDLTLQRANQTWIMYAGKYTPTPASRVAPGAKLFDLIPGDEASLRPAIQRALAGETVHQQGRRSRTADIVSFWDSTIAPLVEGGHVIGLVEVKTDATERLRARQELEQRVAERTRALSALNDVITAASGSLDLPTVLRRSIERVVEVIGSEAGAIHLLGEADQVLRLAASKGVSPEVQAEIESVLVAAGLAGAALARAEPLVVPLLRASPRPLLALPSEDSQSYVGVPIRSKGRPIGVLSIVRDAERPFDASDISLLTAIAGEVGVAVENARLYQHAQQIATVRERERLARELHDSVTQSLYSLTLLAEASRRWAERRELARVEENLQRLTDIGQQALKEMRLLVYELRPLVLRREGLVGAIQQRLEAVEKRAGVSAELLTEGHLEAPQLVEEELYRIAQEALNNALKHSSASSVTVHVVAGPSEVVLRIVDDGAGFDPGAARHVGGMGLVSMRERAEKIGGSMKVTSSTGCGTTVEVRVPHGWPVPVPDRLADGDPL